jgi:hypothetical protein
MGMGTKLRRLPAEAVGHVAMRLFEHVEIDLPNPLVYANFSHQCEPALRRSLLSRNGARSIRHPAVNLLRYPPGTLVNGDRSYLTVAGDAVVDEQIGWQADWEDMAHRMREAPAVDVTPPCLLLARFGESTWGHWTTEMLAKAAVAERLAPGRFHYAVPWWTTEPQAGNIYADRVLESLAAYGIEPGRLVRLLGFRVYRFAALHDIPCKSADGVHPGALDSLVGLGLKLASSPMPRRIAALRRAPLARAVANIAEITNFLRANDFELLDLQHMSFLDQVRHFAAADLAVASLGSEFWAIPHARPGISLVSLAPASWDDGYFIRLFQNIEARHGDVRGPSTLRLAADPVRSPHLIDPDDIGQAIEAALSPATPDIMVDGQVMPRRLGKERLHVFFGKGGNAASCLNGSWSEPEATHTWSLGAKSEIVVPRNLLPPGKAFWMTIEGQGHVYPPHLPTRPMTVLIDGSEAGHFDLISLVRLFVRVHLSHAPLRITFRHPICPSPRMMGRVEHDRPLGFGFESIRFYEVIDP